jgi:hypothetical protein
MAGAPGKRALKDLSSKEDDLADVKAGVLTTDPSAG